jgi:NADPH-dependent curcumin reductase CurA
VAPGQSIWSSRPPPSARRSAAETIVDGVENAPGAFIGLMRGENIGKMLVRVGGD